MRYLLIQETDNKIINIIEWNGVDEYKPEGCKLVLDEAETYKVGDIYA